MVIAETEIFSALPANKYCKPTRQSTPRCHQLSESKSGFEGARFAVLGALHSLRSIMKLSAEKRLEMHLINNEENRKWIDDFVDRETTVTTKQVPDAETAILQELNDMTTAENMGATTWKPDTTCEDMFIAIGDSLSDLASSDNEQAGEDGEDDEDDTELGKLSDDDEPGWVVGPISQTVRYRMESFRQMQRRLDKLTKLGWWDVANYFGERGMTYGTTEVKVPAVVKPQIDMTAATPYPTTFGEHMRTVDIVCGQLQLSAVTSRPGSRQMRQSSEKTKSQTLIQVLSPDMVPNSTLIHDETLIDTVGFHCCI
jgi:Uri superfamily endonuclease